MILGRRLLSLRGPRSSPLQPFTRAGSAQRQPSVWGGSRGRSRRFLFPVQAPCACSGASFSMRRIKPDSTEQFPAIPRPRPLTAGDTGKRLSPPLRPGYLYVRRRGPTGKFVGRRRVVAIWRQCLLNTTGVSLCHTAESVKAEVMRLAPAARR